jgi:hypothetical protein
MTLVLTTGARNLIPIVFISRLVALMRFAYLLRSLQAIRELHANRELGLSASLCVISSSPKATQTTAPVSLQSIPAPYFERSLENISITVRELS